LGAVGIGKELPQPDKKPSARGIDGRPSVCGTSGVLRAARIFVLHLARALYGMCGDFRGRFIATVAARVWEDTDDRTVRKILTDDERDAIRRHAENNRRQVAGSENATHLLLSRASIAPKISPQTR
jgi:hypothetical protein